MKDDRFLRFKHDNKGSIATNLFHTFDKAFGIVVEHMNNMVRRYTDIELREVEIPQKSAVAQRNATNVKGELLRSILPRAVALYNLEDGIDEILEIPNTSQMHRLLGGPAVCLFSIKKKNHKYKHEGYYWGRDIDVTLIASPNHTSFMFYYSILVSERAMALELLKRFKFLFPNGVIKPIFAEIFENDGEEPIIKPYTLEAIIPDKLIEILKSTFGITDTGTDGDLELLKIIQEYSNDQVDYISDGTKRERAFSIKYSTHMNLRPTSIELIQRDYDNISTHGIKLGFTVDYIEFPAYNLVRSLEELNPDSKMLSLEEHMKNHQNDFVAGSEVYIAAFSENIDGLTILSKAKLTYDETDMIKVDLGNGKFKNIAKLDIVETVSETPLHKEYFNFIYDCYPDSEVDKLIKVEAKRVERNRKTLQEVGNETGFAFADGVLQDDLAEVGKSIYVAIYVNKKHMNDWMEAKGWRQESNLTAYN